MTPSPKRCRVHEGFHIAEWIQSDGPTEQFRMVSITEGPRKTATVAVVFAFSSLFDRPIGCHIHLRQLDAARSETHQCEFFSGAPCNAHLPIAFVFSDEIRSLQLPVSDEQWARLYRVLAAPHD